MHLPALVSNLSNGKLAAIITGYNTNASKMYKFYPTLAYFDRINKGKGNKSQSRDKILYIILAFEFYPVMMVAIVNHWTD